MVAFAPCQAHECPRVFGLLFMSLVSCHNGNWHETSNSLDNRTTHRSLLPFKPLHSSNHEIADQIIVYSSTIDLPLHQGRICCRHRAERKLGRRGPQHPQLLVLRHCSGCQGRNRRNHRYKKRGDWCIRRRFRLLHQRHVVFSAE